ncbi:MAG: adenylyltransferase/cytidyltransferase family protein [Candidatus Eremiobacteraeota bacterium]|nr:adenylyltransferase/cytidyltransferase family protein [Candidatus Eremiobacteraeota bacterium]MBV9737040.1 adenylyltransferase/cytidyltransferase family protein [Candidatus Eremiobacteraeota bacterium]
MASKPADLFAPVLDLSSAVEWRNAQRSAGRSVVFTNGCFDLIHAGHVEYLAWAREQGDVLIVGLNTDTSVRKLKGERRPLMPFADRARILSALRSVDAIVGFSEPTPEVILEQIQPEVHVKSAQYREDELPERTVVRRHGGRIVLAPHRSGSSTTALIATILQRYADGG